jgi:hypothetical protein
MSGMGKLLPRFECHTRLRRLSPRIAVIGRNEGLELLPLLAFSLRYYYLIIAYYLNRHLKLH